MTRIKGQLTESEYLPFKEFRKLLEGLHKDKLFKWEFYCKFSYCTALRVSDILTTKWKDILQKDEFYKIERKTGKGRLIKFNPQIRQEITDMYTLLGKPDPSLSILVNPNTNKPYSREYINRKLKYFRVRYRVDIKHFSTHTFRKTFARNIFEENGKTMEVLFNLQKIFNHSSPRITLAYMGFVQEDMDVLYNSLHF